MATEAVKRFRELVGTIGRPALGALFPGEFEVYIMTLELVDSQGNIADYFSFPVLPDDITKSEPELTNIKKTAGGVTSLSTNSFVPQDVTINGNFGRAFRILLGTELVDFKAFGSSLQSIKSGKLNNITNPFDVKIKTGYGCTKMLQSIVSKSTSLDSFGKPFKLFFYNPTLGESHLVEKTNLTLRMDKNNTNRMWGYSLSFKLLAPANSLVTSGNSSLAKSVAIGVVQKGINVLAGDIGQIVRKGATSPIATASKTTFDGMKSIYDNVEERLIEIIRR